MEIKPLGINGAWLATSLLHFDERGSFREWFKQCDINEITGRNFSVEQANISISRKGVLRGIHYSLAQEGQAKWITCASGRVIDLIVDIRPNSPTFLKYELIDLQASDGKAVYIGAGLGHGFLSIKEDSAVTYLLDSPFSPVDEFTINPLDPELRIEFPLNLLNGTSLILSAKDSCAPNLFERLFQNQLPLL